MRMLLGSRAYASYPLDYLEVQIRSRPSPAVIVHWRKAFF